jgi:adenylate cyclase
MTVATQSRTRFVVALNADVVGYSRLMADDFEGTAAVVADYHQLVEEKVEAAGGNLVVFVGDNFMAVFEHATNAMAAAIAISTEIEGRNADLPEHRRVRFRMGLDQGEVTITPDGQYYGDALNIAARIQALAVPGGVSVSGDVYRALDEPELRFKPSGQRTLKNIPGSVPVYDFRDLPVEGAASRKRPILATPSVAVLPIHVEAVEESLRGAGPILVSDLVDRLTAVPGLRVIDATDEDRTVDNDQAIDYMLNSGIHQFGENLRVYVKLMDFATINVVFSRRWDATADTLLTLSDSIGEEVARFLEVELVVGEPARIYSDLGDPKAQENIYRGWFQLNSSTREGFQRALEYFEEVDRHHPDETVAAALLAFTHWVGVAQDLVDDPEHHLQLSKEYARRGIDQGIRAV